MGQACTTQLRDAAPGTPAGEGDARREQAPVRLNIYSIGNSRAVWVTNRVLRPCGTGAFHCGVEVYGAEWSYSHVEAEDGGTATGTGVFACWPRQCKNHLFCETVQMGATALRSAEVQNVLEAMRDDWHSEAYHTFQRNCVHFCTELCWRLGVSDVPEWVKSLADLVTTTKLDRACCGGDRHGAGSHKGADVEFGVPPPEVMRKVPYTPAARAAIRGPTEVSAAHFEVVRIPPQKEMRQRR